MEGAAQLFVPGWLKATLEILLVILGFGLLGVEEYFRKDPKKKEPPSRSGTV